MHLAHDAIRFFVFVPAFCAATLALGQVHHSFDTASPGPSYGGFPGGRMILHPVEGQVAVGSGQDPTHLRVRLVHTGARQVAAETVPQWNGAFEFGAAPAGHYEVQVLNRNGDLLANNFTQVPTPTRLVFSLVRQTAPIAGTVSPYRLTHKVPRAARRALEQARSALVEKKPGEAELRLRAALRADAEYTEAQSLLGALCLDLQRPQEASEWLARATELDPQDAVALANLSLARLRLDELPAAEAAARQSLQAYPLNARARYFLALSLLGQKKAPDEIAFHLTQASDSIPAARRLLEELKPKPELR